MASLPYIDPRDYPLDRIYMGPEEFGRYNPQRHEFLQLTNLLHYDHEANLLVASREIADEEWWMRGHIPGRPLLPGALMVEMLAQAGSLHSHFHARLGPEVFIGFAGLEKVRFRGSVAPGTPLWIAGKVIKGYPSRHMYQWDGQIMTEDGTLVCTGQVIGLAI